MILSRIRLSAFLLLPLAGAAPDAWAQDTLAQNQPPAALVQPTQPAPAVAPPEPLTLSTRYKWAAVTSVSPSRLAGYSISSGISTWSNTPEEYGPHWEGYGKRVGIRVASGATGIFMEATVGALWGEDPRYVRAGSGQPLKKRLGQIVKMTFLARDRNGNTMPAYARYISIPGNSYLSNAWRADSEATTSEAAVRIPWAFVNRAIGISFTEFWPDVSRMLHRK